MDLTPVGVWHFYDGRAGMEPRICELREEVPCNGEGAINPRHSIRARWRSVSTRYIGTRYRCPSRASGLLSKCRPPTFAKADFFESAFGCADTRWHNRGWVIH
jgi:hypothetical protein